MAWTDERIALLKQYWAEGHSASQIAELLGDGLSRNAVIGKAHRMGLASRPSPLKAGGEKAAEDGKAAPARREKRATRPAAEKAAGKAAAADAPADAVTDTAAGAATPASTAAAPMVDSAADAATDSAAPAAARPAAGARKTAARLKDARVTLLDLNERICKWPIGHPDEADFHFCGKPVNPGFPYCVDHCLVAYQAQLPRRERAPGEPPRPHFGPNLPRPR